MSAEVLDWHDEYALDYRRRVRTAAFVSLAVHACVVGLFAVSPPRPVVDRPASIDVQLVSLPAAPRAGRSAPAKSAPKPAVAPKPPAAPPAPPAPAAPPIAKAPVQVLPEETPGRIRKAKPAPPKVVAEPEPTPAPQEKAYANDEDALAALMAEMGGDDVAEMLESAAQDRADAQVAELEAAAAAESAGEPGDAAEISPEQLAWDRAVTRKIARQFPDLARYRGRGLVARVEVQVAASGAIVGEPRLVGTSGDLDFDRSAISAIGLASPLPPPPAPGVRVLNMRSEER